MKVFYKHKLKVSIFFRKPSAAHFSLEHLFAALLPYLNQACKTKIVTLPFYSTGFWNRIRNALFCQVKQGDINHISGDVHYVAVLLKKSRTILTIHDLEILKRKKGLQHAIIKYFWFTLPVRRVSYVTVISEATRNELLKFVSIPSSKIKVIYNCLPTPMPYLPKLFNITKPVILQVGTKQNKNIPRLAEAIRDIPCQLIILGKLTEKQTQKLHQEKIDFENYVNLPQQEVADLYARSDMLAFVSTEEGFGIPILEAQAMGRAVVTSNISSMPEAAGDGACFVNPYNVASIREGILKIITDAPYRENLIKKGLENVKRFDAEKIAAQYVELYQQVFEESRKE